jgi:hypothetical protein
LLPGKTIADGLRILEEDKDTNVMFVIVSKIKNFVVYFDHDDTADGINWDDIIADPVAELHKVLSPQKVGEKLPISRKVKKFRTTEGESSGPRDNNSEEFDGFVDSDNEIKDGDEDLVEALVDHDENEAHVGESNVRKDKKAKGFRLKALPVVGHDVLSDEEDTDDEGLELPDSGSEGEGGHTFKSFRDEDMRNSTFSVGLVFPSREKLREVIDEYTVRNRVDIKLPRNDKIRIRAHCDEGCPWNLYASFDSRMKSFVVKTYYGRHNCQKQWKVRKCTARWIADKYVESFRANEKMSITSLSRTIQKKWNINPSRSKVARARRMIMR